MQKDIFPWKRKGDWGSGERRGKKRTKCVWSQKKSPHKGFVLFCFVFKKAHNFTVRKESAILWETGEGGIQGDREVEQRNAFGVERETKSLWEMCWRIEFLWV